MKPTGTPQVQHYVPKFILRSFGTGRRRSQVFVYDKHEDRVFLSSIANMAAERRFYDIEVDDKTASLEPLLSDLESEASVLIATIRSKQSIGFLSDEDRVVLSNFLAVQMLRTRQQREILRDFDESLRHQMKRRGIELDDIPDFRPLTDQDIKLMSMRMLLRPEQFAAHLITKSWVLLSSPQPGAFFCSDNPVALQNTEQSTYLGGNLGLAVPGIEIYFPLSPKLVLALYCPSHESKIREIQQMRDKIVEHLGAPPHLEYDEFAERLSGGIDSGDVVEVPEPIITNINSLQIIFSTRFLFSRTKGFPGVSDTLSEHPELKKGLRIESN